MDVGYSSWERRDSADRNEMGVERWHTAAASGTRRGR